jgi:hypothetical protein
MWRASRLVIIALLGLSLALPVGVTALPAAADPVDSLAGQPPSSPSAPPSTAPSQTSPGGGPGKLKPDTEADKAETQRKLIMGGASVVLVGLVLWGRSIRRKKRKAAEGG